MYKQPSISKFGWYSVIAFLLLSLAGRFLFPFGDEPDFTVRAPKVLFGEHSWWSPYYMFHGVLENLNILSECKIDAGAKSLWASIDYLTCSENLEQVLIRFFIIFIITLPLLLILIFRKSFIFSNKLFFIKLTQKNWKNRLDTLSLTLLFPGIIYYLGVLAQEQFVLLLALFIFLFWESKILVFSILFLIMSIDFGNSIVILLFILFTMTFQYISKKFSVKTSIYSMFFTVTFAFIIGYTFLSYLEQIAFLADKASAMNNTHMDIVANKYPVIFRPLITFVTSIFMTPSGIKILPLYIVFGGFFVHMFYKIKRLSYDKDKIVLLGSVLTTIVFFVFLFPGYSNAKYYIFMLPFILYIVVDIYTKEDVFKLFVLSNVFIFINLILYNIKG